MKVFMILLSISLLIVVSVMTLSGRRSVSAAERGVLWYKKESGAFVASATHLENVFSNLSTKDSNSVKDALLAFKRCRLQYKRISFFMEYFFPEEAVICNGAPVQEMESQEEFREPAGLQVIESLLCSENPYLHKKALVTQANLLVRTVENFSPLLNDFKAEEGDILESLSLELIRIITLYISGFDAPQIKTGIEEAHESLSVINELLDPFIKNYEQKDSIDHYLYAGREYLKTHSDFDSFDRLFFITRYALPIERLLNRFISGTGFRQNPGIAVSFHVKDLFEPDAINKMSFPHTEDENDTSVTALGKQLFFEPALSGNNTRSCATCHSPGTFFGDGLSRNRSIDGKSDLPRNTPSLLYVCYQYAQFWDGRAESLEDQIREVLKSRQEMNVSEDTVVKRLSNNALYAAKFKKIWANDAGISVARTAGALAAFIRTLTPFRSSFDRYMQGDRNALTLSQQRGFNVFMGKAQCGTCHFAPMFGGLLPPDYKTTEFEILGVTADDKFEKPRSDGDQGRFGFIPFPVNKGAFKTPSIRNAAMTGPYMHNGRFSTLEKVIDFYDKGGGAGLGLDVPQQTLSGNPLKLSEQEKSDIIAFIEALSDK